MLIRSYLFLALIPFASTSAFDDLLDLNCVSHDDCDASMFCASASFLSQEAFKICNECESCADGTTFDGGECPLKCNCQSDSDCGVGAFCGFGDRRVCNTCATCVGNDCPSSCFCESSEDCAEGEYCRAPHSAASAFPVEADGRSTCESCASYRGCASFALMDLNESCEDICPDEFECDSHDDCAGDSAWCSQNHKCKECSNKCFSEARLSGSLDSIEYSSRFHTSIDLGCPESCCGWGLTEESLLSDQEFDFIFNSPIGHCPEDSFTEIEAYWTKARHPDWTPQDFQEKGTECNVTRLDLNDGNFPEVVTLVDCYSALKPPQCESADRTVGVLAIRANQDAEYTEGANFPIAKQFISDDYYACEFVNSIMTFVTTFWIVSFVVGILAIGACIFCCVMCCCRN